MTKRFTESFKLQAVEKALTRTEGTTLEEITERLGIARSTLTRWILGSGKQSLKGTAHQSMKKETRPQDLSLKERLAHVINCSALDTAEISQYCRESGIYAHHIQGISQQLIGKIEKDSVLCSDGYKSYIQFAQQNDLVHKRLNLSAGIRVIDTIRLKLKI